METNKVLLRVCVITSKGNELECLLPLLVQTEILFEKLRKLINDDVKAYYYNGNNLKVDVAGKLSHILGIVIGTKKKHPAKKNESSYGNNFSILDHIRTVTSEDTVAKLASVYGGMRVYIPKRPKKDHLLAQLIGWDNLQVIIQEIGDGYMVIPAKKYRGAGAKAQRIFDLLKEKKSVREIAQIVDCCERTVWIHKSKYKACMQKNKL